MITIYREYQIPVRLPRTMHDVNGSENDDNERKLDDTTYLVIIIY
jgi:hypothetical protein